MSQAARDNQLWRGLAVFISVMMSLVLTACPRPLTLPLGTPGGGPASVAEADRVTGTVDFGRRVQADLGKDVMPGATVSVIDVDSGATLSTALTDAQGNFILTYSNTFRPQVGKLYYFEAIKGLDAGTGAPNAVGSDLVRVRTIASFGRGGWVSLTSARVGFHIPITPMTTALSIVVSLRSTTNSKLDASTMFGAIRTGQASGGYPDTLAFTDLRLVTMVQSAYGLVLDAFLKDRDPVRWIQLSSSDPTHYTVTLPDVPFTLLALSPPAQVPLGIITLIGSNYDGAIEVYFQRDGGGKILAQGPTSEVPEVSPDRSRIRVKVPAAAVNGPVELRIMPPGTTEWKTLASGQDFMLAVSDGHSVVNNLGHVFAVNRDEETGLGNVVKVAPQVKSGVTTDKTEVREVIANLNAPGALTFGPGFLQDAKSDKPIDFDYLFVALGGVTPEIRKYNLSLTVPTYSPFGGVGGAPNPSGMAFGPSGKLYVSDAILNRIFVISDKNAPASGLNLPPGVLNQPRGLAFDPDGLLCVANTGANNVIKVDVSGPDPVIAEPFPYVTGLSAPWGVAFDSKGSFYVSNNQGNSIYTIPVTSNPGEPRVYGALTSFATIPTPGGLDADATGYLYVADKVTNGIYRINSQAESLQIGYGISQPVATWADADGVFILTQKGQILQMSGVYSPATGQFDPQALSLYASGLTGARGLVRDAFGDFYTNQKDLGVLTKIYSDGSLHRALAGITGYKASDPTVHAGSLYFKRGSGVAYQAELDAFALPGFAGPTVLKGVLRRAVAVAHDYRTPYNTGTYYILQGNEGGEQAIRVYNAGTRTTTPFTLGDTERNYLMNPKDIAVDAKGRVWVADQQGGPGNDGRLLVFNEDGSLFEEITDIEAPTHLTRAGAQVVANSFQGLGYVRFYAYNDEVPEDTIVVTRTFTGFSLPAGVAFTGNTMFVNSHATDWVYRIQNYSTIPLSPLVGGSKAFSAAELKTAEYLKIGKKKDIEATSAQLWYTTATDADPGSNAIYAYNFSDGTTDKVFRNYYYGGPNRMSLDVGNRLLAVTHPSWVHLSGAARYGATTTGIFSTNGRGDYWSPNGSGGIIERDLGGGPKPFWVTFGRAGAWSMVVETAFDGTRQTTEYHGFDFGALASDRKSTVYLAEIAGGRIYKWANGRLEEWASRDMNHTIDHTIGLSYYEAAPSKGMLYQPVLERHLVREVSTVTKNTRRVLRAGLMGPEL